MKLRILLLALFLGQLPAVSAHALPAPEFAVATLPTPVFSTPDIPEIFGQGGISGQHLDSCGQLRELEFVALPGTVFAVEGTSKSHGLRMLRVSTNEYKTSRACFIDSRFVRLSDSRPPERRKVLPDKETVMQRLEASTGTMYVWGSNLRRGIPQLSAMYPPPEGLSDVMRARWELRGVDCSGLLYEATDGWTPRNTSELVTFGTSVPIAGRTAREIAASLKPLDLIVWKGHVIIVLDESRVIESRLECGSSSGVVISPVHEALQKVMKRRAPADSFDRKAPGGRDVFVVRRWYY